jgi:hypothetical protein
MLLAIQGRGIDQGQILTTYFGTIRRAFPYAAIGSGASLAKSLLNRFRKRVDIRATEALAAYVIYAVKDSVEGCGRITTMVTLYAGRSMREPEGVLSDRITPNRWWTEVPGEEIDELEDMFRKEHARAEKGLLWSFIDRWTTRQSQ